MAQIGCHLPLHFYNCLLEEVAVDRLTYFYFLPQTVVFLKILASKYVFLNFPLNVRYFAFRDKTF